MMRHKAEKTIAQYGMLSKGDAVIVGVSGGADSVALLHLLNSLSEEMCLKVIAVHLNHGIRGAEADRDAAYVGELCARWGTMCVTKRVDCAALALKSGEGLEECGRRLRYELFSRVADRYENARIATAHTADDNLETLLLNLTRGASLKGLCGIPPIRGNIIRPLIKCSRAEIEAYCFENGLEYMTDSTNLNCDYSRNLLRNRVVPVLRELNPDVAGAAERLTDLVTQDETFLNELSDRLYTEALRGKNTFDAAVLRSAALPLRSRLYTRVYASMTGQRLSDTNTVGRIEDVLYAGGKVQLQKRLYVEHTGENLCFFFPEQGKRRLAPTPVEQLPFFYDTGLFRVQIAVAEETSKIHRLLTNDDVDCDTICGELVLRGRVEGDRLTLPARNVTKSLKKLFSEEHIDSTIRDAVPLLADDSGVVWVQGFGANRKNAATAHSKTVIRVKGEGPYEG